MLRNVSFGLLIFLALGSALWWWYGGKTHTRFAPRMLSLAQWRQTAPGIEVRELPGDDGVRVTAVRIDPRQCAFRVAYAHADSAAPGDWAEQVCPAVGVAINASYFADDRTPIGLLVVDGKQLQRHFPVHQWGAFQVRDGQPELVVPTQTVPDGVTQAFECKPRLLVNGQCQRFKPQGPNRRSAVGMDAQGRVILAATAEGYLTLEQWAAFLQQRLQCVNALNLDGGPSTQLAVRGSIDRTVTGGGPVPVFLTVSPK